MVAHQNKPRCSPDFTIAFAILAFASFSRLNHPRLRQLRLLRLRGLCLREQSANFCLFSETLALHYTMVLKLARRNGPQHLGPPKLDTLLDA